MSKTKIKLPESLTIHRISDAFEKLQQEFEAANDDIILICDKVDTIDTSGLQSLLKLIDFAKNTGKTVTWSGACESVEQAARQVGLSSHLGFKSE